MTDHWYQLCWRLAIIFLVVDIAEIHAEGIPRKLAEHVKADVDKHAPEVKYQGDNDRIRISYRCEDFTIYPRSKGGTILAPKIETGPISRGFLIELRFHSSDDATPSGLPSRGDRRELYWNRLRCGLPLKGEAGFLSYELLYQDDSDLSLHRRLKDVVLLYANSPGADISRKNDAKSGQIPSPESLLFPRSLGGGPAQGIVVDDCRLPAKEIANFKPDRSIRDMLVELNIKIGQLAEKRKLTIESKSTMQEIQVAFRTREFHLHDFDKDGKVNPKTRTSVGPLEDGFIIKVHGVRRPVKASDLNEFGLVREAYWSRYVNSFRTTDVRGAFESVVPYDRLQLEIVYGAKADTVLFDEIELLLQENGEPALRDFFKQRRR